jgi:type VII secretion effector (TIGR04197 family)
MESVEIKSNERLVNQVSAQINSAASSLVSVDSPTMLAEKTTVAGNEKAQESISSLMNISNRLANVLVQDSHHLKIIAGEFTKMDQLVQRQIEASFKGEA